MMNLTKRMKVKQEMQAKSRTRTRWLKLTSIPLREHAVGCHVCAGCLQRVQIIKTANIQPIENNTMLLILVAMILLVIQILYHTVGSKSL